MDKTAKPLTLQEAKDQVAKKYGYTSFNDIVWYAAHALTKQSEKLYESYADEAYKLWNLSERKRTWDEACKEQRDRCVAQFINSPDVKVNQYTAREYCANAPKPEFKP